MRVLMKAVAVAVAAATLAACGSGAKSGESGTITIGTLQPLSGAAASYGPTFRDSIQAYFDDVNARGGVNGKKLKLKVYDSGYDPAKSLAAARKAVTQDDVFAFVGVAGTSVVQAVNRYLNDEGVPNMWVLSGAPGFNSPESPLVFPFLLSYSAEPKMINEYLSTAYPEAKVGVLYQNDDFGKSFLTVFEKEARDKIVSIKGYDSADTDVSSQIASLKSSGADIVVSFVLGKFAILAGQAMGDLGWDAPLVVSSNSNDPAVLGAAGPTVWKRVIAGTSYPSLDADDPAIVMYRETMKKYSPKIEYGKSSLEAFTAARLFVKTLEKAGDNPSRKDLVAAAESLNGIDDLGIFGGVTVTKDDHSAVKCTRFTKYTDDATLTYLTEPICE